MDAAVAASRRPRPVQKFNSAQANSEPVYYNGRKLSSGESPGNPVVTPSAIPSMPQVLPVAAVAMQNGAQTVQSQLQPPGEDAVTLRSVLTSNSLSNVPLQSLQTNNIRNPLSVRHNNTVISHPLNMPLGTSLANATKPNRPPQLSLSTTNAPMPGLDLVSTRSGGLGFGLTPRLSSDIAVQSLLTPNAAQRELANVLGLNTPTPRSANAAKSAFGQNSFVDACVSFPRAPQQFPMNLTGEGASSSSGPQNSRELTSAETPYENESRRTAEHSKEEGVLKQTRGFDMDHLMSTSRDLDTRLPMKRGRSVGDGQTVKPLQRRELENVNVRPAKILRTHNHTSSSRDNFAQDVRENAMGLSRTNTENKTGISASEGLASHSITGVGKRMKTGQMNPGNTVSIHSHPGAASGTTGKKPPRPKPDLHVTIPNSNRSSCAPWSLSTGRPGELTNQWPQLSSARLPSISPSGAWPGEGMHPLLADQNEIFGDGGGIFGIGHGFSLPSPTNAGLIPLTPRLMGLDVIMSARGDNLLSLRGEPTHLDRLPSDMQGLGSTEEDISAKNGKQDVVQSKETVPQGQHVSIANMNPGGENTSDELNRTS